MGIYFANIFVIGIYSLIYNSWKRHLRKECTLRKVMFSFAVLQMFLLLALRDFSVGVDVIGYVTNRFIDVNVLDFKNALAYNQEWGYTILNRLIWLFSQDRRIFLIIISAICMLPVGAFVYEHSKMPFLSLILYITFNFYSFIFSGLRQGIAYAITFISLRYIKERKFIKFLLLVLFATTFHKTALVFLPAYFIYHVQYRKRLFLPVTVLSGLLFLFRAEIILFIVENFYEGYDVVYSSSYTWMALGALILVFGSFFYKETVKASPDSNGLYMMLLTGVILMLFASAATNAMRIATYYFRFLILFIPEIIQAQKNKRVVVVGSYILVMLSLVLYYLMLARNMYGIVPYRFFWQ